MSPYEWDRSLLIDIIPWLIQAAERKNDEDKIKYDCMRINTAHLKTMLAAGDVAIQPQEIILFPGETPPDVISANKAQEILDEHAQIDFEKADELARKLGILKDN
jgi:hypothetical protein